MIARATREGLAAAGRNPRLAATLWLVNLTLALAFGVPGWLGLRSAIAERPGPTGSPTASASTSSATSSSCSPG